MPGLTASQTILLAAADLHADGAIEFTEWDLSVASWKRDPSRFGLRGYAATHPDHKRVMMEVMCRKPFGLITQGLMQKVRPNVYKATPLGLAEAARLRVSKALTELVLRNVAQWARHPAFLRWREDPDEPRQIKVAREFLAGASVAELDRWVREAITWCNRNDVEYLVEGPRSPNPPIHYRDLADLLDFLTALTYRFAELKGAA